MLLTNLEVLKLVKEEKGAPKSQDLNTLDFELLKYFTHLKTPKIASLTSLEKELRQLPQQLQDIEILHLINHLPTTLVELNILIEEFQDRFNSLETTALLETIQKHQHK